MYKLLHSKRTLKFIPIFLANLFFSFHYNSIVYLNSSYLEHFFTRGMVSLLFVLGSAANLILFFYTPQILKKIGNKTYFLYLVALEMLLVVILTAAFSPFATALAFVLFNATSMVAFYSLDIFLEDATVDKQTGFVRGAFLTITNLTLIFSPLLISLLAPNGEFFRVYVNSILFLIPVLLLGLYSFKDFHDGTHRDTHFPFWSFWEHKNIRRVTLVRLVLDIFYAFMVIYMPLYLHQMIGFSWSMIGIIFAFMLVPFILIELPAGELADQVLGEKEMLTLGLFIMGTSLLVMPFLHTADTFNWAVVLFMSRVGASLVEIMTETYFFKKVDKSNTGFISIFRTTWPVGFTLCPIVASISLGLFPFAALFLVMAILTYQAMEWSTLIQDTA